MLAVPPRATLDLIARLAAALEAGALLTDVCSVKAPVVKQAVAAGLGDRFAGGHPLAGTHETGFGSARPDRLPRLRGLHLRERHLRRTPGRRDRRQFLGAHPGGRTGADQMPRRTTGSSPGPAICRRRSPLRSAKSLAERGLGGVSFGSGAKDTTRLAASNPEMWVDILLYNQAGGERGAGADRRRHLAELRRLLAEPGRCRAPAVSRGGPGVPARDRPMKVAGTRPGPGRQEHHPPGAAARRAGPRDQPRRRGAHLARCPLDRRGSAAARRRALAAPAGRGGHGAGQGTASRRPSESLDCGNSGHHDPAAAGPARRPTGSPPR